MMIFCKARLLVRRIFDYSIEIAGDIYSKYGSNASFKGWYLSFEVDNWNFLTSTQWDRMNVFYQNVSNYLKSLNSSKTVMISPFYNTFGGQTSAAWQTMWQYILAANPNIDILALQDGVGA
ncbi:DUF4434 domain-containing protein [Paenibacillus psychroresistens]|uniref:DUF4434 domain-containing protein n=1 Tax=Paenibacillus psychroresistens TaxID=1778678 RepID=A0A6B8RCI2_9BACL|nr:DUF4434 domain-containing protein [Paenibacillus psychroresistens]QGQ93910.1 DUF4434 domain-containing protein [Paenibacillus psychroresistens]